MISWRRLGYIVGYFLIDYLVGPVVWDIVQMIVKVIESKLESLIQDQLIEAVKGLWSILQFETIWEGIQIQKASVRWNFQ